MYGVLRDARFFVSLYFHSLFVFFFKVFFFFYLLFFSCVLRFTFFDCWCATLRDTEYRCLSWQRQPFTHRKRRRNRYRPPLVCKSSRKKGEGHFTSIFFLFFLLLKDIRLLHFKVRRVSTGYFVYRCDRGKFCHFNARKVENKSRTLVRDFCKPFVFPLLRTCPWLN